MVRSVVVRLGKAVSVSRGGLCSGKERLGVARQSRLGNAWCVMARQGKAVKAGQVAVGRVVEWLGEERHGSHGMFRQVGSRLC